MAEIKLQQDDEFLCPVCGFEYVHLTDATTDSGGNDGRLDVVIAGWCENSHQFEVRLHQHKGETSVQVTRLADKAHETQ